jgi:hypothetical protein
MDDLDGDGALKLFELLWRGLVGADVEGLVGVAEALLRNP